MRITRLLFLLTLPCAAADQIDLVKLGRETFHAVGCAECHSEIKDDASVKTGPGLYGLFQKTARKRSVLSGGEQHRQEVTADLKYLTQSLRSPISDLAIAESGATKGEPYLPVMPPYDRSFLSDKKVQAIHHYLLTLNEAGQAGPATVMADKKGHATHTPALQDRGEILVTDRTRIYRTRLQGQSARTVAVGTPAGLNYSFDPRTLSIEKIWWGGFLNIGEEMNGRGKNATRPGQNAFPVDLGGSLLAPIDPTSGKAVDLSFKSPKAFDYDTIAKNLNGLDDFMNQAGAAGGHFQGYHHAEVPTFHFKVGANRFDLQFQVDEKGAATLALDGTLHEPQSFSLAPIVRGKAETWTVSELPVELKFTIPVKNPWRPIGVVPAPLIQKAETAVSKVVLPAGYSAEAILPPVDPQGRKQLFEPLGMDLAPDGSLIVSTRTAGLWKLKNGLWAQIAEGLLDALGVIVESESEIIVGQKPELTRLRDEDGDGWMDHYETLSDDFQITANYHEYLHGPAKDASGNYYIQLNLAEHPNKGIYKANGNWMGAQGGFRGWSLKVTPEGKMTSFARGLRSPAGLATGPDGKLYYTENQGEYQGTSKLFLLEEGKFYGHPSGLVDLPKMNPSSPEIAWDAVKATKEKALALMPQSRLANSPGSPVWAPENDQFGPFAGQMFVGDQTLSNLFRILPKANHEAALIPFAHGFPSGVMRVLFDGKGSLYAGQTGRGWRAKGGKEHALVRISRSEAPIANQLVDVSRTGSHFQLHFSQPLEKAPNLSELRLDSWTYLDSPKYGSPENGKGQVALTGLTLSEDKKSLTLQTAALPDDGENRVFHFQTKALPATRGDICEAFYSIVKK
ncbi:hypothetical protein N9113_04550 [Akkermansiaceae bacterium]|nr:hypothetical protein [Akkermansiaceae bacterium]